MAFGLTPGDPLRLQVVVARGVSELLAQCRRGRRDERDDDTGHDERRDDGREPGREQHPAGGARDDDHDDRCETQRHRGLLRRLLPPAVAVVLSDALFVDAGHAAESAFAADAVHLGEPLVAVELRGRRGVGLGDEADKLFQCSPLSPPHLLDVVADVDRTHDCLPSCLIGRNW